MKLLASDYDQTFYISDSDIQKNIREVTEFMKEGNIFVLATGRSYEDLMKVKEKYHFSYNYLAINHGATILDKDDKILFNKTIPNHIVLEIKKHLDLEKSISYFCCTTLESRVDFTHENLTKIAVTYKTKEEALAKAEEINSLFNDFIQAYYVNKNSVEITSKLVGKEEAISYIAKINKIIKEDIYTIGDGYSDINMIKSFNGYGMNYSVEEIYRNVKGIYSSVSKLIQDIRENKIR